MSSLYQKCGYPYWFLDTAQGYWLNTIKIHGDFMESNSFVSPITLISQKRLTGEQMAITQQLLLPLVTDRNTLSY